MYVIGPDWLDSHANVAVRCGVVAGSSGSGAPTGPSVNVVTAGPTTVKTSMAGVGSTFRLGSIART